MPQTLIKVSGVDNEDNARKLVAEGEQFPGIRLINVNTNDGRVVITHTDTFDLESFKHKLAEWGLSAE